MAMQTPDLRDWNRRIAEYGRLIADYGHHIADYGRCIADYGRLMEQGLTTGPRTIEPSSSDEDGTDPDKDLQEQGYLIELIKVLTERFDKEGLRSLCLCMRIDYDDLPADGKAGKARELVKYLAHRDRICELLEVGRKERRDIAWDHILG